MTASQLLKKAASVICLLADKGIQGNALYDCALAEATSHMAPSLSRATVKFRCHALMRLHLVGDAGPGPLAKRLEAMTAQAIADACEAAGSDLNSLTLDGFNPSAGRRSSHWSDTDA